MRGRIVAASLVLLTLPLATVTTGHAGHANSCDQTWHKNDPGSQVCLANLYGVPVVLSASATCDGCMARVHAIVQVSTSAAVLAECEAEAMNTVSCDAELTVFGVPVDTVASNIPLTCSVSGNRGGNLFCDSGCWSPTLAPHCELLAP